MRSGVTTTPQTKLSTVEVTTLTELINELPADTDMMIELKSSLLESLPMTKSGAVKHIRIRLEPAVLINDDVTSKRVIYRTILRVLSAFGLDSELKPGVSIVTTTIDTLFNEEEFTEPNKHAKELYHTRMYPEDQAELLILKEFIPQRSIIRTYAL